jgi:putative transposase
MASDEDYGTLRAGLKERVRPGDRVWWDRGYIPHIESHLLTQHVCYHLADSLPTHVIQGMLSELKATPPSLRSTEMEQRVMAYLDAGHGSCVLREPELALLVQDAFILFHGVRYTLYAWCVMPNHVHVLFKPLEGWTMSRIIATWKSYTGRRISEWRQRAGLATAPTGLPRLSPLSGGPGFVEMPGGPTKEDVPNGPRVWQREYFDRYIRDDAHFANALRYIHANPVKAGIAASPEDWPFSSHGMVPRWERMGKELLA